MPREGSSGPHDDIPGIRRQGRALACHLPPCMPLSGLYNLRGGSKDGVYLLIFLFSHPFWLQKGLITSHLTHSVPC